MYAAVQVVKSSPRLQFMMALLVQQQELMKMAKDLPDEDPDEEQVSRCNPALLACSVSFALRSS